MDIQRYRSALRLCRNQPESIRKLGSLANGNTDLMTALMAECYWDIGLFHNAVLGRPAFWSKQEEMARLVMEKDLTVILSGNAVGKSFFMSTVCLWYLYTRPRALVFTTACSQSTLNDVLWRLIRQAFQESVVALPGKISRNAKSYPQRLDLSNDAFAIGISTTSIEKVAGRRSSTGHTLIVCDEASGIDESIYEGLSGLGAEKQVLIGNPIKSFGRFYNLAQEAQKEENSARMGFMRVSSLESPDIDLELSPRGLACKKWLELNRITYGGESSLWYRCHVAALFSESENELLVPTEWLDLCSNAEHIPGGTMRLSVDLATGSGGGNDSTCICVKDSNGIYYLESSNAWRFEHTAKRIADLCKEYQVSHHNVVFDRSGCGVDFNNRLLAVGIRTAKPYNGSKNGPNKSFVNMRTSCAWAFRMRLDPDRKAIPIKPGAPLVAPEQFAIKEDHLRVLREELSVIGYSINGNGSLVLDTGEVVKERLKGRSPDHFAAIAMSFCYS